MDLIEINITNQYLDFSKIVQVQKGKTRLNREAWDFSVKVHMWNQGPS